MHRPLKNEAGTFDLPSIVVGVAVVAILVLGVLATLFSVIPWSQDLSAKQDLKALADAETTIKAIGGQDTAPPNMRGLTGYQDYQVLVDHEILSSSDGLAAEAGQLGNCFVATSTSATGKVFWTDNLSGEIAEYRSGNTSECGDLQKLAGDTAQAPSDAMLSTWNTSAPGCGTIQLPIDGAVSGNIDWGDGTTEPMTVRPAHTYADPSTSQKITLSGTFTQWTGTNTALTAALPWSRDCITSVDEWGEGTGVQSIVGGFAIAPRLTDVAKPPSTVTDMTAAFYYSQAFNGDIGDWDTSNVTSMRSMFNDAQAFNADISRWNTGSVTDMGMMFYRASAFNQPIGSWNTSKLTTMGSMFSSAISFNQPLASWDTRNVSDMRMVFSGATSFNQPIGTWNTGKATSLIWMFANAPAFNQPIGDWDTSNVTSTSMMFAGASSFNQPIGDWNTGKVTAMSGMLEGAEAFNQPIGRWDTRNVENMAYLFAGASSFNQPLSGWNVDRVTMKGSMFAGAVSFNQDLSPWKNSPPSWDAARFPAAFPREFWPNAS